jgi:hypothetical protein
MSRPVFSVDFNEMLDARTVLLSAHDSKVDASGVTVLLREGMLVSLYMSDLDRHGSRDDLVACGVAVKNTARNWSSHVKWCCRIDDDGIRARSKVV